jgi:hypothetical protein
MKEVWSVSYYVRRAADKKSKVEETHRDPVSLFGFLAVALA